MTLGFIIGLVVGGTIGVSFMCFFQLASSKAESGKK